MYKSPQTPPPRLDDRLAIAAQISFVLGHPGMSAWLKNTLRDALPRDPVCVLNDLEILNLILRKRCATVIDDHYGSQQTPQRGRSGHVRPDEA